MSNARESLKKPKNIISIELRKELNLLPNVIKEKKLEKDLIYKELLKIKEKISTMKKELDKASVNIFNMEKDYCALILKNDKIKANQKILLNIINNELVLVEEEKKEEIKKFFNIFFNFENDYKEEISNFLNNSNIEITKLLIGAYAYLKMLQIDIPLKYKQMKEKILDLISKAKQGKQENIYNLIISYVENIFTILDYKEKNNNYDIKHESLIKKKNEIFIKLKLIEEQKKEKEEKLNIISIFIKDLTLLLEKNKLLMNFPKNNLRDNKENKNTDKNKIIDVIPSNLNTSCPKNTIVNDLRKTEEKISIINIDLTSTSSLEKKYYIKSKRKTIESFDINNEKGININKYKNVNELEKDISDHFIEIKNNPLFKTKKKILKKKMNNNFNINNNNYAINKQNKLPKDKSKEKKMEKISKNNTTMTFNTNTNSIVYNINNLIYQKEVNKSYDSTLNKKEEEKEKGKEKEKIKLTTCLKTEINKIIQIKPSANSSPKKMKEEKKNNFDENKEKTNVFLNENNVFKNNKYISIKHNKTNLMKKNSMNKMKMNPNKKEFDSQISFNSNSIRKNSPENSVFFKNINSNRSNKNRVVIAGKNEIKNKNKSPTNNTTSNNSNKNCHIIPFKKYKINYIKDKNNITKMKKINTNNYHSDKIKGNNKSINFDDNSQFIKSLPKEGNNTNKNSYIKV